MSHRYPWEKPEMSVKVEKIEPLRQARFKISSDLGQRAGMTPWEMSESEAREIYEGLVPHFGGQDHSKHAGCYCHSEYYRVVAERNDVLKSLAEKDAEIARWRAANIQIDARAQTIRNQNHEQVAEINRLKKQVEELQAFLVEDHKTSEAAVAHSKQGRLCR